MTELPQSPKGKHTGLWIAIGVAIVASLVIVVYVLPVIIPSPSNTDNTLNVSAISVTLDDADEAAIGHTTTAYIVDVSVNRVGSSSVTIYPTDFYFVTSDGTFQADQSGFFSDISNALNTVTLSNGQTTTGQIYDSFSAGTTISSVYYSYSGSQYSANTPPVSSWISDITLVTATASNNALYVVLNAPAFNAGPGDVTSGTSMYFNITVTNTNGFFGSSITINYLSVNSPFTTPDFNGILPVTLSPGSSETITFYMDAPMSSYYGAINFVFS